MPTVGILEAGENLPELSPDFGTFGSWFEQLLADALAPATFKVYRSYLGELPEAVTVCDAYVITGSRASVNDPDQWIEDLGEFSRQAGARLPVVGVCFGHQLLHKAFGGRVERAAQGWGIGVHDYRVCAHAGWMPEAKEQVSFCASHNDQVVETAPGTAVIAASEFCPIAMTTIGENILTVQGHPEMSRQFSHALYELRRPRFGDEMVDDAIRSLDKPTDSTAFAAMVARFLEQRRAKAA